MRSPLLLLVLLCCEGDVTSEESQTTLSDMKNPAPTTSLPPTNASTTSLPSTKADTLPSTSASITPGALPTSSAAGGVPGTRTPSPTVADISPNSSNMPPTGTTSLPPGAPSPPSGTPSPPSGTPSPHVSITPLPSHTPSPAHTSTSPTTGRATSEVTVVVTTTSSPTSLHSVAASSSTATTVLSVLSSTPTPATPTVSVATPATVLPRATPAAGTPDSAATSPSQKPKTTENMTVPGSSSPTEKEQSTQSGQQSIKPEATKDSSTKPGVTVITTTRQSDDVRQTSSSRPETVVSITASTPLSRDVPPPQPLPHNQVVCEAQSPSNEPKVFLMLNETRPCASPVNESLHNILCKAMKAEFNPQRDVCTVRLAVAGPPSGRIAVLDVSMQSHALPEELFERLGPQKDELQKLGISNVTYTDKHLATETKDRYSTPLVITIVCMASALLLIAAIYGCCHQRLSRRKDQQRLTEELQTMENGYHDNPTLEVMETPSEMQEKKVNLNGELGDSWIVPMDSLLKEELEEEEDTHL
ncbi:podocalyxin [Carettochelys insculpta]|uniref:podocalyxin n=1 Tax=Carettochelys insculpta TaxID=44489 RepID=UPI003EBDA6AF